MKSHDSIILDETKTLFKFVSPERLRRNITYLLTQYFINTKPQDLPDDTPELVEDIEFLLIFIDKASNKK